MNMNDSAFDIFEVRIGLDRIRCYSNLDVTAFLHTPASDCGEETMSVFCDILHPGLSLKRIY